MALFGCDTALIVSLKLWHLKVRASDPDDEPIGALITSWLKWTLGVTAGLLLLGLSTVITFPGEKVNPYRAIANTVISLLLLIGGFVAVFIAAGKIQGKIEKLVDAAIEKVQLQKALDKRQARKDRAKVSALEPTKEG